VIVIAVPTPPEVGERLVTFGGGITVNVTPLLVMPFAVTVTGPVVAPVGTIAVIDVAHQSMTFAGVPLKLTAPNVVPKFTPVIVTSVPTPPEFGDRG
jgi:hypothetical protein